MSGSRAEAGLVTRGRLARLGDTHVLFSPLRQEMFDLNETAAAIWRALEDGVSPETVAREMGGSGRPGCAIGGLVAATVAQWERLDLVHPPLPPAPSTDPARSQLVSIAGTMHRLAYVSDAAVSAAPVFRHLEVVGRAVDLTWTVADGRDRLHLFRRDDWIGSCRPVELPTVLKGHLLTEVLSAGDYEIALHTAALESDGRAILLSGRPGAGKTTLTLALAAAGLVYGGDDVTLVTRAGRCVSLPFAPAVKSGSWALLGPRLDGLATAPVFRRPDGRRVRYPAPAPFRRLTDCPIGWIILIDRRSGIRAELTPIDPAEAFRGLLSGAFAGDGELTEDAFEALARAFRSAALYRLSYADLSEAVDVVRRACR